MYNTGNDFGKRTLNIKMRQQIMAESANLLTKNGQKAEQNSKGKVLPCY
jgi:hypothetical protein